MDNPKLPKEIEDFSPSQLQTNGYSLGYYEELCELELKDVRQQISMRPYVAVFYALLLVVQNVLVFWLVVWTLLNDKLGGLQPIFTALIAGSLIQTYKISQLIVEKLFEPIDYNDKERRFNHE